MALLHYYDNSYETYSVQSLPGLIHDIPGASTASNTSSTFGTSNTLDVLDTLDPSNTSSTSGASDAAKYSINHVNLSTIISHIPKYWQLKILRVWWILYNSSIKEITTYMCSGILCLYFMSLSYDKCYPKQYVIIYEFVYFICAVNCILMAIDGIADHSHYFKHMVGKWIDIDLLLVPTHIIRNGLQLEYSTIIDFMFVVFTIMSGHTIITVVYLVLSSLTRLNLDAIFYIDGRRYDEPWQTEPSIIYSTHYGYHTEEFLPLKNVRLCVIKTKLADINNVIINRRDRPKGTHKKIQKCFDNKVHCYSLSGKLLGTADIRVVSSRMVCICSTPEDPGSPINTNEVMMLFMSPIASELLMAKSLAPELIQSITAWAGTLNKYYKKFSSYSRAKKLNDVLYEIQS